MAVHQPQHHRVLRIRFVYEAARALMGDDEGGFGAEAGRRTEEAKEIAAHLGASLLRMRSEVEGDARSGGGVGSLRAGVRASFGGAGVSAGTVLGLKAGEWRQICRRCGIVDVDGNTRRTRISSVHGKRGRRVKGRRLLCVTSECTRCGHRVVSKLRGNAGAVRRNCIMRDMRASDAARTLVNNATSNDAVEDGAGERGGGAGKKKRKRGGVAVDGEGRRRLT